MHTRPQYAEADGQHRQQNQAAHLAAALACPLLLRGGFLQVRSRLHTYLCSLFTR